MKKTFTINISGTVFHIEEDAYEILQQYLINLKKHFGNDDEGKEIIADIEARIAEIFSSKSDDEEKVITVDWVNEVIETMGTPEDFAEEAGEDTTTSSDKTKRKRRLYRDPDNRVFGGVCSGLAAYFNMDTVVLRIILVVLFLLKGFGFLAYVVLWIVVPKAKNTAQRLEMRGQEATVKNIEKSIKEEVKDVKESFKKFKKSNTYSKGKSSMEGVGDITYNVFRVILKVCVILFGVFLMVSAFIGIVGLISSMIIGHSFAEGIPLLWGPEIHVPNMLNHFVEPGALTWGLILVGLIIGLPLLAALFIGTKLVFRYKSNNTAIGLGMVGVWIVSIFALLIISVGQVGNYKTSSTTTQNNTIECNSCQTLYLHLAKDKLDKYAQADWDIDNYKAVVIDGKEVIVGFPKLDIERSSTDDIVICVKTVSRGKTNKEAKENCKEVVYNFNQQDSAVYFDPYFFIGDDAKWRNQEVDVTIKVPEGKTVYLGENMAHIINDIENVSNTWDGDMVNKYWVMKPEGLTEKIIE